MAVYGERCGARPESRPPARTTASRGKKCPHLAKHSAARQIASAPRNRLVKHERAQSKTALRSRIVAEHLLSGTRLRFPCACRHFPALSRAVSGAHLRRVLSTRALFVSMGVSSGVHEDTFSCPQRVFVPTRMHVCLCQSSPVSLQKAVRTSPSCRFLQPVISHRTQTRTQSSPRDNEWTPFCQHI